ncbi:MAG: Sec-independent protein translocase protein TatB [Gallionella sp.]|nr:Sec-independent protein translocase protein TatB [Gallionella sp.]
MFDFSISELMVVMVVALIVIGPERLPKVARTMGHLWGRAQRYVNGVKADIERDMAVEEFRQLRQTVQAEASAMEQSLQQAALTADQQMQQIEKEFAQLSPPGQATQPGQISQQPPPGADPSLTPPANNSQ